jgi:DNA polymerase-3 subunit epsilon
MRLAVFDLETTGVDVENDRIITAFVGLMVDGEMTEEYNWVINPGVPVPDEAAAVHGYTTERVVAEGDPDAKRAVFDILQRIDIYDRQGIPVVIYNAPFDLTLLDRELLRHGYGNLYRTPRLVIDPYVMDKAVDPYRKGKRTLSVTAEHYGITVKDAHDARADCVMAGRLAEKLLEHPRIKPFTLEQMQGKTRGSKRMQAESYREYLIKQGKAEDAKNVSTDWPFTPRKEDNA